MVFYYYPMRFKFLNKILVSESTKANYKQIEKIIIRYRTLFIYIIYVKYLIDYINIYIKNK